METVGRIQREHLVKGKSIKELAHDLKISRNTVRKILRSGETSFSYEREVQPRPRLGRRALRNVSTTLIHPVSKFRLGS